MSDSTQQNQTNDAEQPQTQATEQVAEPTYSKSEVERILAEARKFKTIASEYEKKMKENELKELEKNNEWQRIAKMKEEEAERFRQETEKLKSAFVEKEKMNAIREIALANGLRKESIQDLRLIDFPEIKLETNNEGEFTVSGADKAVMRLKALRPHWFQTQAPSVNTQTPSVTNSQGSLSWSEFKKIQDEYKRSPTRENEQKLKLAMQKVSVK